MRTRQLFVATDAGEAQASFEPHPGQFQSGRRRFKAMFWTCVQADKAIQFLQGLTAHKAHIELITRSLKWRWVT
jgi:hypothetical protein